MANKLTKIIAGLLIAIAVILGIYAWMLGRSSSHPVAPAGQPIAASPMPVVVATRALVAGQPISADALKIQPIAPVPVGSFSDPSAVVGRVPASDIPASSPVVGGALVSGLAEDVQPGERAVAIRVEESNAVANRLRPGNFVDVFLNLKRDPGGAMLDSEIGQTQARLLLSKVRVLSFGDATPDRDAGAANGNNGQPTGVRIAVLAVPTPQVDALTLGEGSGRLTLALRNPRDDEMAAQTVAVRTTQANLSPSAIAATGVSLQQLSGTHGGSVAPNPSVPPLPRLTPAVRPSGGGGIEVIRGGRSETVVY
ncbi:Flp pilus assembly protein CpaB [Burkholderia anthina]|uniref:Flp pilus assembly protein CpaB n=1 Tax=Burkholderia anthina TaxID=179879 RepID=UPI0037C0D00F